MRQRRTGILKWNLMILNVLLLTTLAIGAIGGVCQAQTAVGIEYVTSTATAQTYALTGINAAKWLPDSYKWGSMQTSATAAISWTTLDNYVKYYQAAGLQPIISLKSYSSWASKSTSLTSPNYTPKSQYMSKYADWVSKVVERYDMDGVNDMPGLLRPVNLIEIGVEFSSYEPEPVGDYLEMLQVAYSAAHAASATVKVAHAAFFGKYMYDNWTLMKDTTHDITDVRKVLARTDIYDVINFHALVYPEDIASTVAWLRTEAGYSKPIIISDTLSNPLASNGWASDCANANNKPIFIYPAKEADWCRLASFFTLVINNNTTSKRWLQGFTAEDLVKKAMIAVAEGVDLINLWSTVDVPAAQAPLWKASSGTTAWAGILQGTEKRAGFYALKQFMGNISGYTSATRVQTGNSNVWLYRVQSGATVKWIGWLCPTSLILPGDAIPQAAIQLSASSPLTVESTINTFGKTIPDVRSVTPVNGTATITLTPTPVYIY